MMYRKPLPLRPGSYHFLLDYNLPSLKVKYFFRYFRILHVNEFHTEKITINFTLKAIIVKQKLIRYGSQWQQFTVDNICFI